MSKSKLKAKQDSGSLLSPEHIISSARPGGSQENRLKPGFRRYTGKIEAVDLDEARARMNKRISGELPIIEGGIDDNSEELSGLLGSPISATKSIAKINVNSKNESIDDNTEPLNSVNGSVGKRFNRKKTSIKTDKDSSVDISKSSTINNHDNIDTTIVSDLSVFNSSNAADSDELGNVFYYTNTVGSTDFDPFTPNGGIVDPELNTNSDIDSNLKSLLESLNETTSSVAAIVHGLEYRLRNLEDMVGDVGDIVQVVSDKTDNLEQKHADSTTVKDDSNQKYSDKRVKVNIEVSGFKFTIKAIDVKESDYCLAVIMPYDSDDTSFVPNVGTEVQVSYGFSTTGHSTCFYSGSKADIPELGITVLSFIKSPV
jgi:hypothetical protein